jgi:hypothetical protein
MTTEVRNLKPGNIFTDSGITVRVESIERDDLVNGTENYRIVGISIDYNKKKFSRMQLGLPCYYSKKGDTKISVK